MSDVVAVIPARSGSKGVPDKNIRALAGKPLLSYSIVLARKISIIDRVIVSTDSKKYAKLAKKYGAEIPFLRPPEISGDMNSDYDFIRHLLDSLEVEENYVPDFLVHLRPTTPFRNPELVEKAIETLIENPSATSLRSAHEMPESAYKQFEIAGDYFKAVGSGSLELDALNKPRQAFPKTYSPNGYVDVLRTSFINKNKLLHGNKVMAFITPRVVELDSSEDFNLLECMSEADNVIIQNLWSQGDVSP